jgi:hypothetical protein
VARAHRYCNELLLRTSTVTSMPLWRGQSPNGTPSRRHRSGSLHTAAADTQPTEKPRPRVREKAPDVTAPITSLLDVDVSRALYLCKERCMYVLRKAKSQVLVSKLCVAPQSCALC